METTANLDLPYIMPSQAQKHVTHNEALRVLDGVVQLSALAVTTVPPPAPSEGDRHIAGAGASGAWAGWDGSVAYFADGGWIRLTPQPGWLCWVEDTAELLAWTGATWQPARDGGAAEFASLGVNTVPDALNRLAVKADAVLLSHDDVTPGSGTMHLKLNKADETDEAALFLQRGFSGRAGLGCFAGDLVALKTSADGAAWRNSLLVDPATGRLGVNAEALDELSSVTSSNVMSVSGVGNTALSVQSASNSPAAEPFFAVARARGASLAAPAAVQLDDRLGAWLCAGRQAASWAFPLRFGGYVDGVHGTTGQIAGRWGFETRDVTGSRTERLTIKGNGDVGIGTTSPTARLHVNGSLSKTSGSFDIPHPDPALTETHRLRHCFVEAPTRGENIYRFSVEAEAADEVTLPLPGYWRHLNENPQVWISPNGHFGRAHGRVTADGAELVVTTDAPGRYDILLVATRTDRHARDYFDPLGVEYEAVLPA
jgi:hypothetical protein